MYSKISGPAWEAVFLTAPVTASMIVGIDEVGRGCWAGPVVAGAVILPNNCHIDGLNDSKLISPKRRKLLDAEIRQCAVGVGLGWVSAAEVDKRGLSWAVKESGRRALAGLNRPFDFVLLDGTVNYFAQDYPSAAAIKADSLMVPVAAASIVAKVARDNQMIELAQKYPNYGFENHKGYGTVAHIEALRRQGVTPEHRLSYKPLREYR